MEAIESRKELEASITFLKALSEDVKLAEKAVHDGDDQFSRRTLVRTFLAMVEGSVFILKQEALRLADTEPTLFTSAEMALLREESYELDRGKPRTRTKFIPVDENLRFAIQMYMRDALPTFQLRINSLGWESFKTSIAIRNRITHPKQYSDLEVTDAELEEIRAAVKWFWHTVVYHMLLLNDHLESQVSELETRVSSLKSEVD
jgi:hypothetical protein